MVIGAQRAPFACLIAAASYAAYQDRISVVGFDKATRFQFGNDAVAALPSTADCMEFIALNYVGPWQQEVRGLCAKVALGEPIGNGSEGDDTDGGSKAALVPVQPKSPSGALVQLA